MLENIVRHLEKVPSIQIGGTSSKSMYQFTLKGQDTDELYREATDFRAPEALFSLLPDRPSPG